MTTDRHRADWECWFSNRTIEDCANGYLNEIADRDHRGIMMMHDYHDKTLDLVKYLVPLLKKQGYTFVRLDKVPGISKAIEQAKAGR